MSTIGFNLIYVAAPFCTKTAIHLEVCATPITANNIGHVLKSFSIPYLCATAILTASCRNLFCLQVRN